MHCIAQHYNAMHSNTVHCTTMNSNALHYIAQQCTLHCTAFRAVATNFEVVQLGNIRFSKALKRYAITL